MKSQYLPAAAFVTSFPRLKHFTLILADVNKLVTAGWLALLI